MNDIAKSGGDNRIPLGLKIIILVSNFFSGLLVSIILVSSAILGRFPYYVTKLNAFVGIILSISIFGVSLMFIRLNKKVYLPFLILWAIYEIFYIYNRYLDFINGAVGQEEVIIKISISIIWLLLLGFYFKRRAFSTK